jgi:hypothetical protein
VYLSGDPSLADDLVSEAFVRVWTARERVEQATVRGYLFAIVRNLHLQHLRHERRRVPLDERVADGRPDPEVCASDQSRLHRVMGALQNLPEIDRAAVLMRANGELPYQEIAAGPPRYPASWGSAVPTTMRMTGITSGPRTDRVLRWLLEGDPAIRWQTLRDLIGAPAGRVERERLKVSREGWGARLLATQDPQGGWATGKSSNDGLYSPKWISTTYTLLTLRDFGLSPASRHAQRACRLLLDGGLQRDGGINYGWRGRSETCITGMILSILSYFEHQDGRLDTIAAHLLEQQMPDGGWNCRRPLGATHASVHTTISALEGLRHYELHRGRQLRAVRSAQRRGREFLLVHRLFRSHRTGAIIKPEFTLFSFPPRWHYDILRALDHFQAVNAPCDQRLAGAIDIVHERQRDDGRWTLQNRHKGRVYFELERLGAPSRWNTLRALRVLKWWEQGVRLAGRRS